MHSMRSKRFFLMLVALFTSLSLAMAQKAVTGEVISASDAQPIIGASIVVKGNPTIGVQTDINGRFSFEVPTSARYIVVSYVGMKTKEVIIESRPLKIFLEENATMTDAVVVTGYGTTSKKAFTGAASSISDEKVKARFDANPINALKGNMPGLTIANNSGQPGAPTTIFVRGRNSLNSGTQPLYVIDGVPIESGIFGTRVKEGVEISPLSTLSMSDIETLTVLKDASATSIYGARAANGVIVITTKKGRAGFKLNFTTRLGGSSMPVTSGSKRYRPIKDANLYREMLLESMANPLKYSSVVGLQGTYEKYYKDLGYGDTDADRLKFFNKDYWEDIITVPETGGQATDWLKEVTRTGMLQNYALDISGGGDNPRAPRYYVAFDYLKEDGMVIGKDLGRYSIRLNLNQEPYKFFKYGINAALSLTETNMGTSGGYFTDPITQAFMQNPFSPVMDGKDYNTAHTINGYNPVAVMSKNGNKNNQKQYRALVSPYVTITFLDWLSFTSRYGLDAYILDDFGYWSFYTKDGKNNNGYGENGYFTNFYQTITNTLNVNKSWEDHHLRALVGQEGQSTYYKEAYMSATNYPVKDLNVLSLASKPGEVSSNINQLYLLSFFSNAEYDYASRYYLSASLRADASSRFHKNNRWGVFYSLGAKWRIASEAFMKDAQDYVQELTLRSSWGTTGNQSVGTGWYAARGLYSFGGFAYAGNPGMFLTQFENPDLKWEKTRKFNFGFDTRLFNFLSLSIDYYNHLTTDMAFLVPLSKTVGNADWYENIGKLRNQGVEFELGFDALQTQNALLRFSFTGAWNQNRIVKLSTDKPIERAITIIEPGKDIYSWKMKEWAGVDPETGVGRWYKNRVETDEKGNKRTVIDHSTGTTTDYNEAPKVDLGKASPDFQGGFRTDFSYKNFDFSILLNYQLGGKVYGDNLGYDEQTGSSLGSNFTQYVADNRWRKPGQKALVPMLYDSRTTWNNASSRFLMSSDYLKIQNIMVGYTIEEALPQVGVGSIRFFFSMDNVYTFVAKDYRGFDPASIGANGFQWWNYPMSMKFTGGVTITF